MELSIEDLQQKRRDAKEQALAQLKRKLHDAKNKVKQELARNTSLSEKVNHLATTEREQGTLLDTLDSDLHAIKTKMVDYEQSTRLQDDQNKFIRAVSEVQQGTDLTQLTMLALKVTE